MNRQLRRLGSRIRISASASIFVADNAIRLLKQGLIYSKAFVKNSPKIHLILGILLSQNRLPRNFPIWWSHCTLRTIIRIYHLQNFVKLSRYCLPVAYHDCKSLIITLQRAGGDQITMAIEHHSQTHADTGLGLGFIVLCIPLWQAANIKLVNVNIYQSNNYEGHSWQSG